MHIQNDDLVKTYFSPVLCDRDDLRSKHSLGGLFFAEWAATDQLTVGLVERTHRRVERVLCFLFQDGDQWIVVHQNNQWVVMFSAIGGRRQSASAGASNEPGSHRGE